MDKPENTEQNESATEEPVAPSPASRASFKRRHWGKLLVLAVIALPVGIFAIWTGSTLGWSYSNGNRPGYMQKISRKGWICKTWEGTLYLDIAKGFRSDSFQFTVRSDSIAHLLQGLSGKKVDVQYEQHVGVPTSCFGDSQYFVSGVREIKE